MRSKICVKTLVVSIATTAFIPWCNAAPASSQQASGSKNNAIPFSPGFPFDKALDLAISLPSHSWEFGTAAEALLELYNPDLSVFGESPFKAALPGKNGDQKSGTLPFGLAYAASKIVLGTGANALSDGDGAVGDPASLGVSAVLLGKYPGNEKYALGAKETVEYVTGGAPRAFNGAISHRVDIVELWADFIYMAPPFLAYYAADTHNASLLQESVNQCRYYRDLLQVNTSSFAGLWEHILGPQNGDPGLWSTGNAWAAAGMTRVLATVLKAPKVDGKWRSGAVDGLTTWIREIVDGVMNAGEDSYEDGLVKNYIDNPTTFGETSGSMLMAATVYRMVVLQPAVFGRNGRYVRWADGIRRTLGGKFLEKGSGEILDHVDKGNGTVRPAVNPLGWGDVNPWLTGSPEGQGFSVLMYAAWRDCVFARKCERD